MGAGIIGAISTGMGLVEKFIAGESQEDRLAKELESQKVSEIAKTRRALIRKSTGRLRIFALAILTVPLIWGMFDAEAVGAYFAAIDKNMPTWWIASLQAAFSAIWAGAELRSLNASRDEKRLAEKEAEAETEKAKQDRPGPPGGGGR